MAFYLIQCFKAETFNVLLLFCRNLDSVGYIRPE